MHSRFEHKPGDGMSEKNQQKKRCQEHQIPLVYFFIVNGSVFWQATGINLPQCRDDVTAAVKLINTLCGTQNHDIKNLVIEADAVEVL